MPEYVYTSRPNPFVGSIGDVMLRRGDIAAQRAAAIADIEGRAGVASGAAWGHAAENFGAIAGGMAKALTDPRRQMQALELQRAKDLHAGEQRLDEITKPFTPNGPQEQAPGPPGSTIPAEFGKTAVDTETPPSPPAAPTQHPYLDDQGLYDIPKLTQALSAGGMTHLVPELLKGSEAINDAILKHQSLQQKADEGKAIVNGDMAHGVLTLMDKGMPFDKAFDFTASPGFAATGATPQQYVQLKQQLAALPPDQQRAALTRLMDQAAQLSPEKDLADGAQRRDRYGRLTAENEKPDLAPATFGIPQPDGTVKNVEGTFNKKTGAYAYQGQVVPNAVKDVNAPPPPVSQAKSYRVKGVGDVPLEFVPGRTAAEPGAYFLNKPDGTRQQLYPGKDFVDVPAASVQVNANVGAAMKNMPGWALDASRPSGADGNVLDPTLRMTPNGLFQDAQNFITSGQYPPTGRGNDEAAQLKRAAIDSKVGAIAAAAAMDVPTLRAFFRANAKSLQQLQSSSDSAQAFMATADKNSALLEETLKKLPDTGSPFFNRPLRAFAKEVAGDKNMGPFATYLTSVKNEYAKIISNPNLSGQLTDSARHEAEQLVADNATIPQMLGSLQALKNEGTNRIVSLGEQIQKVASRMNGQQNHTPTAPADGTKGNVGGKPAVWHTNGPKGPGWYSQ